MKQLFFLFCFLSGLIGYGQSGVKNIDDKYLEDQFYLSLAYNIVLDQPNDMSQNGFSGGVTLGFIRDLPINEQRTFGFGVGLGYALNVLVHNLKLEEVNNDLQVSIAQDYTINRWTLNSVELPIEIRWRNSTPVKYRFWRIYTGVKFLYVFASKAKYRDTSSEIVLRNIDKINNFQYGLQFSAGYGNWNIYLYYGLKSMFKDVEIDNEPIVLKDLSVGIKFYIM
jgi:hypothetical protein